MLKDVQEMAAGIKYDIKPDKIDNNYSPIERH